VRNAIFNLETPQPASSRKQRWISYGAIFCLISASTAVMMLCPCDVVGIHRHYAVSLVALAFLFGIAAAYLVYRRMRRDSGITPFLRAVIALAIVGVSVYAELFVAMEIVAWMAGGR
jgi:drug/metabolite transporter superfamily protein YnfA